MGREREAMLGVYQRIFALARDTFAYTIIGWLGIRLALRAAGYTLFGQGAAWHLFIIWGLTILAEYFLRSDGSALVHALCYFLFAAGLLAYLIAAVGRAITRRARK
jgi:hypothetical protein